VIFSMQSTYRLREIAQCLPNGSVSRVAVSATKAGCDRVFGEEEYERACVRSCGDDSRAGPHGTRPPSRGSVIKSYLGIRVAKMFADPDSFMMLA
jgi:hypothetical protein